MKVPAPSLIRGGKGSFLGQGDEFNRLPKTIRLMQHAAGVSKRPTGVRAAANPVTEFLSRFTGNSDEKREDLKEELLEKIRGLERGAAATEEEKAVVDKVREKGSCITFMPMLSLGGVLGMQFGKTLCLHAEQRWCPEEKVVIKAMEDILRSYYLVREFNVLAFACFCRLWFSATVSGSSSEKKFQKGLIKIT
jgi:hypothetical protein